MVDIRIYLTLLVIGAILWLTAPGWGWGDRWCHRQLNISALIVIGTAFVWALDAIWH